MRESHALARKYLQNMPTVFVKTKKISVKAILSRRLKFVNGAYSAGDRRRQNPPNHTAPNLPKNREEPFQASKQEDI